MLVSILVVHSIDRLLIFVCFISVFLLFVTKETTLRRKPCAERKTIRHVRRLCRATNK